MRNHTLRSLVLLVALAATPALAQRGQGWSVLSGQTVGAGQTAFHGEVGWPGLGLSLLHGSNDRFDIGGKFTFNYGVEGVVDLTDPGIKLQLLARLKLVDTARFNFGLRFEPGPFFYFQNGGTMVGLALPVALDFGIPVGSAVMVNFGMELPLWVTFGEGGGASVPVMFGGGLEYFLDRNMAVTFRMMMGPTIDPRVYVRRDDRLRRTDDSEFTLESSIGIALRF